MDRALRWATLIAVVVLVGAALSILFLLGREGATLRVTGIPTEITLRMVEPVQLVMPDGTHLEASVSGTTALPVELSLDLATCPTCGEPMVPVRYHLFTGEIEWACPHCDDD
ncbi:MAG: hypothetical protein AB1778_10450 [Candidatus Bipolaricaulota bacterium]